MTPNRMSPRRAVVMLIGSVLVVVAAFTVLWSAVATSTAQLSASTTGAGFFSAGTVELDQPETVVSLLFDADGLYPGQVVSSCVELAYHGSLPADIRLHGSLSGGTGLEEHVVLRFSVRDTGSCAGKDAEVGDTDMIGDADPAADVGPTPLFAGLLAELWRAHPDYADGVVLQARAEDGDRLLVDAEVEMVGGDEAQGLTTEFSIVIEARP